MEAAQKCTKILLTHGKIREEQQAVYLYGFELLFSTAVCIGAMFLLGALAGCLRMTVTFFLYFFPIRIAAGGYHAGSYRNCFFLTNGIAAACVVISGILRRYQSGWTEGLLLAGLIAAILAIWRDAPIIPGKYRHKTGRYRINRRYAHMILATELIMLLPVYLLWDRSIAYTAVITTCSVAIMMQIAKKGEV